MPNYKKDIGDRDDIQSLVINLRSYIERNKTIIITLSIIAGVLLILMGSGYLYYLRYDQMAEKAYSAIFEMNLKKPSTSDNNKLKIKEYKELIANYPYSGVENISYFRLGNLYLSIGEIESAIDNLTIVINKNKKSELYTLALIALGECFEAKKDFKKSIEYYEKAKQSEKGHLFEGIIYMNMARSYENLNEFQKSKDLYEKSISKLSDKFMKIYLSRKVSLQG